MATSRETLKGTLAFKRERERESEKGDNMNYDFSYDPKSSSRRRKLG